jgi:hypothetical protein
MLLPTLDWLLKLHCPNRAIESQWADLRRVPRPSNRLSDRIKLALELYECDLLFVHRDAERQPVELRHKEIHSALEGLSTPPIVCVIPVRMQESWLLFDERAIRKAAGNPNGRQRITLPLLSKVENLPDPKKVLFQLIRKASGLSGARLKKLKPNKLAYNISLTIVDFTPLQTVSSFRCLEEELIQTIQQQGWNLR